MKISVICLASRSGGGLSVLRDLYTFAVENETQNQWQFVLSDQTLEPTESSNVESVRVAPEYKGWGSRVLAELTIARRAVSEFNPDIVLSLQNVDTPARGRYPLAIYMHQALPFQNEYRLSFLKKNERKLAWRQYLLRWPIILSIRRSSVTFVQTHWLAMNLRNLVPGSRIVPIGHLEKPKEGEIQSKKKAPDHFFYPASAAPYKDHRTLHLAIRELSERGVDMKNKVAVTLTREQIIAVTNLKSELELQWYRPLGWLTPEEVEKEYINSVLVFPSLVESLGLPLYEAQWTGNPIVAGDTNFGREALEGYQAAHWFETRDPESLAAAMEKSMLQKDRSNLDGRRRATESTPWRKLLDELEATCSRNSHE